MTSQSLAWRAAVLRQQIQRIKARLQALASARGVLVELAAVATVPVARKPRPVTSGGDLGAGALRAGQLGSVAKFEQDVGPVDALWGTGRAASEALARAPAELVGPNLLGFELMHARPVLRGALPQPDGAGLPL